METENEVMKRKEIYTYEAPWTVYSMGWCRRPDGRFRMAIGSYKEEYSNAIRIIELQRDEIGEGQFRCLAQFDHPYPPTKVMWAPAKQSTASKTDLLATTGDYLRLWNVDPDTNRIEMKTMLNNNKHTEYCAPLTCFDWNDIDPSMVAVCSIDTTCTIWDIEKCQPRTQLIAHDKEVYDIAFATNTDVFGTVGADGSLRMFDLRSLEHSTILYETPDLSPLLRLAWNKQDPNLLAVMRTEWSGVIVVDMRMPSFPLAELMGHQAPVNGIAWAPHSPSHLCSVSEDRQALIWDVTGGGEAGTGPESTGGVTGKGRKGRVVEDPILAFSAEAEVNQLLWCRSHEDWVAISFNRSLQLLKV